MSTLISAVGDASAPPREDLYRARRLGAELREDGEADPRPVMYGHFARFDEWTEIDSFFEGRFLERIAPGAFKKTLREGTPQVLFNHGRDVTLGDKVLGEVQIAREDAEGAFYEVRLFDGLPDLLMGGLRAGVYGASFRFTVMREDWVEAPEASEHNPKGLPERTIREARVPEFGPVTFPAYPGASAAIRSVTDRFMFELLARDEDARRALIELRNAGAGAPPHPVVAVEPAEVRALQDAPPQASAGTATSHPGHGRRATRAPLRGATTIQRPSWALGERSLPR